jgi:hypothetical protein
MRIRVICAPPGAAGDCVLIADFRRSLVAGTAGGAAAGFIAGHPEPLGHHQRFVVDHGGEAEVGGYLGAGEQFLVRGASGGGVRVPAAFRVREAVADLADRHHGDFGQLDDECRLPGGIDEQELLPG